MFTKLKIFAFFLLFSQLTYAETDSKWIRMDTPGNITQIIGGKSIQNFWLVDENQYILHFANKKWKSYNINHVISLKNRRHIQPVVIDSNRVIILIIDLEWKTHIAEINNGQIFLYPFAAPYPLYDITKVGNELYATGNFGLIFKFNNNNWEPIRAPIESHIQSTAVDQKKKILWLGTNTEGVFSWNGKTFHQYKIPNDINRSIVSEMEFKNDTLFINTGNNRSYYLKNNSFYHIPQNRSPFFTPLQLLQNGYFKIKTEKSGNFLVPYALRLKAYQQLKDGHLLLLNTSNQLYIDQPHKSNYFIDFAAVSGIEGPQFYFANYSIHPGVPVSSLYRKLRPSIIINDLNHDHYPDLLLFNISDKRRPYYYLNSPQNFFTDFAQVYGLNRFSYNSFFTYAYDLDGDNIPEIISADFKNNQYYLNVFKKSAGKYKISYSYHIPKTFATNPTQNIDFADIDSDGDLDIFLVYGYSNKGQGSVTFLYNNGYGSFTADTSGLSAFRGWNIKSIIADFNNDGLVDIFLLKNWAEDAIYFQNPSSGQKWIRENISLPEGAPIQQRKIGVTAFDYDNDGDLDIIRLTEIPFISIYENDGAGHFKDVTMPSGLNVLNQGRTSGQLTAGDYDNNGFIDLFISSNAGKKLKNYIFLNNGRKQFEDKSSVMGIQNKSVNFASTCDLDNDGDLDIYGFSEGKNVYWKNNLNKPDFLQIKLTGVQSNSEAIGTKIWIYDKDSLAGYRQTGSMLNDLSAQNQNLVHFGLEPNKKFDVHILFPSGKKIIYSDVKSGTRIYVSEINFPFSLFYTLDNKVYHLLQNKEFIAYALIVILGFLILISCIAYGIRKFNWDTPLTTLIISLNLFIFGLMLYAFSQYANVLRYFIPLMIILFGSLSPIGFHLWIKNLFSKKSNKEKEFQLFQTLINFSHGSWAQSNLNSLQLLYENLSVNEINQSDYQEPFNKRKETFFNLTLPVIAEVAAEAKNIAQLKEISEDIEIYQKNLTELLKIDSSQIKDTDKELFTLNMTKLRSTISRLKKIVFSEHSCNPSSIIQNLEDDLKKLREEEQVDYKIFLSSIDTNAKVLMDPVALANILENCIHNASKAMKTAENKKLTIKLLDKETRVFIEVTDNGPGIEKDKFTTIFENGYSTTGSTGYGLYYSKKILTKYGGRIYVKNSVPNKQTTIVIELQKSL